MVDGLLPRARECICRNSLVELEEEEEARETTKGETRSSRCYRCRPTNAR